MSQVMEGVRILEVAEQTFVPAASAILAEWGAEVIKIEHVDRGDSMRGLMTSGLAAMAGAKVHVLLEHSNRGKQSLAIDLNTEEGQQIIYKLAATCDIFLTNKLPKVQKKLHITAEEIKAHNPNIIYVRGTGQGMDGPDADRGAYDSLAYWHRSGAAVGATEVGATHPVALPAPAFGDSIGAMTIAGGIMGALYHRERTGEAIEVDVSLLGVGMWSMGAAIALSLQQGKGWRPVPPEQGTGNPLVGTYVTADDRFIVMSCLQAGRYWPEFVEKIGRPELATDPRFADNDSLIANNGEAMEILRQVYRSLTVDDVRKLLADFSGQWAVSQDTLEVAHDPQSEANGYLQDYTTSDGTPYKLVAPPVTFANEQATPKVAPEFNEQGDEILLGLGFDMDEVIDLKVKGVVA
jgi:crotonobetainyl-CoA:carnitine CoA-transferase CaiB-like acyl-CoA transferase